LHFSFFNFPSLAIPDNQRTESSVHSSPISNQNSKIRNHFVPPVISSTSRATRS
jgi:hypothetical protein